jgi:hypothetical protein
MQSSRFGGVLPDFPGAGENGQDRAVLSRQDPNVGLPGAWLREGESWRVVITYPVQRSTTSQLLREPRQAFRQFQDKAEVEASSKSDRWMAHPTQS